MNAFAGAGAFDFSLAASAAVSFSVDGDPQIGGDFSLAVTGCKSKLRFAPVP
jgi:hypothetical protein